ETALKSVMLGERGLQRMQRRARRKSFDRGDLGAGDGNGEHGAALHRGAVDQHGARPALARVAADLRPGEAAQVSTRTHEQGSCLDCERRGLAVDGESDLEHVVLRLGGTATITTPAPRAAPKRPPSQASILRLLS